MRCGVYFNTTCRDSSACNAGRCASSLSITLLPLVAAESAYENVCALEIGSDIDSINADQCPFEINFARNNAA